MFAVLPRFTATLSRLQKSPPPCRILPRLALLLCLTLGLSGCRAHPVAPVTAITPARSLTGPSADVARLQTSVLYRQARQDCKRRDYRHAADLLQKLAQTPGLLRRPFPYLRQEYLGKRAVFCVLWYAKKR